MMSIGFRKRVCGTTDHVLFGVGGGLKLMVGLSGLMMLSGGFWFLTIGACVGQHFGTIAMFVGGFVGFVAGIFTGAGAYELESVMTLRAGQAREAGRTAAFAFYACLSLIFWAFIAVSIFWSMFQLRP